MKPPCRLAEALHKRLVAIDAPDSLRFCGEAVPGVREALARVLARLPHPAPSHLIAQVIAEWVEEAPERKRIHAAIAPLLA